MNLPRIAIIGGGPGGLMLARLLKLQQIPFRLFELDESPHSRTQGGTLDIHSDSGQLALKEGDIFSEFEKHARYDAGGFAMVGKDGAVFWTDGGSPEDEERPEIDRRALRKILLNSLDDEMIDWGKKVIRVQQDQNSTAQRSTYLVSFEDGETQGGFDLVVGADGAWSKVRHLVSNEKPFYSGITCVEAHIDNVDTKHPDLANHVGKGSRFQIGDGKALVSQRLGDGSVRTYAMLRVPEDWDVTCDISWIDSKQSKQNLIDSEYSDWEPLCKEFILRSSTPLIVRPLYMLPVDIRWKTKPGVTVIGDAAHLMTPFSGVGVNLALADALDLSHAIRSYVENGEDWVTVLEEFEAKMFIRAHAGANATYSNLKIMFSDDPVEVVARNIGELVGLYDDTLHDKEKPEN